MITKLQLQQSTWTRSYGSKKLFPEMETLQGDSYPETGETSQHRQPETDLPHMLPRESVRAHHNESLNQTTRKTAICFQTAWLVLDGTFQHRTPSYKSRKQSQIAKFPEKTFIWLLTSRELSTSPTRHIGSPKSNRVREAHMISSWPFSQTKQLLLA